MNAKAMLFVHDGQQEIGIIDVILKQRMRSDDDICFAAFDPLQRLATLRSLHLACEQKNRNICIRGVFPNCFKMLPGQNFGRRHQHGLAAGLDCCRRRHQRHGRLARADITLQKPEHSLIARHVFQHGFNSGLLAAGERKGHGAANLRGELARCMNGNTCRLTQPLPDECQRDLPREEFVIGEPAPGRRLQVEICGIARMVQPLETLFDRGEAVLGGQRCVQPFGQIGQTLHRRLDSLAQRLGREPRRHRIDRLDQRQLVHVFHRRSIVRMHHGGAAVEPVDLAGDDDIRTHGQRLFQPVALDAEIGERQFAGLIMDENAIGC